MATKLFIKILMIIALTMPAVIWIANGLTAPPSLSFTDSLPGLTVYYDAMHTSMIILFSVLLGRYKENLFIWIAIGLALILVIDMRFSFIIHSVITVVTMLLAYFTIFYIDFKNRVKYLILFIPIVVIGIVIYTTKWIEFFWFEWLYMCMLVPMLWRIVNRYIILPINRN